ncbi:MAG: hypothetical protein VSS75_021375 [Candidatus Parabeggiatoa sp.]|nr:hypothetical protein [Candidatus Parabeggiatoa sp.]
MKNKQFPLGWNEERIKKVTSHYENQTEALIEDEAAFNDRSHTMMEVPNELVPIFRELITKHQVEKAM